MLRACPLAFAALLLVTQLSGCGLGYYWQAAAGHMKLMGQRRPVAEVLADPSTSDAVRDQLRVTDDALRFAADALLLPVDGSYRHYADTGRDAVVWNVFAAPPLSLEPRRWCFPVAGCVSYRGYFAAVDARQFAAGLADAGDDVFVGGVSAYSTLGRFDDPVLNTMLVLPPHRLAGLLFHELAHRRVYVPGDTEFNEAFASLVEQEGILRWTEARSDPAGRCAHLLWLRRRDQSLALLDGARAALAQVYAGGAPDAARLDAKARILADVRQAYGVLRQDWPEPPRFDGWFGSELNNALLAAIGAYEAYVPALRVLLADSGGDLAIFYARVKELAALDGDQRGAALRELGARAVSVPRSGGSCSAPGQRAAYRGLPAG
jgi:predicted aminopeptidase